LGAYLAGNGFVWSSHQIKKKEEGTSKKSKITHLKKSHIILHQWYISPLPSLLVLLHTV
jgi:hypothetical protein